MKKYKDYISIAVLVIAAVLLAVFEFVPLAFTQDKTTDRLLQDVIVRLVIGAAFVVIIVFSGERRYLTPRLRLLGRHLLWCVPCFLVVLANFPFTALIGGSAQVTRTDLIGLFLLQCVAVGLMEETMFRGLIQPLVADYFKKRKYGDLITVAVTSAVFGLFHLLNLFSGAGVGDTLLQVGYSFLIGAMLSAVLLKTENLWLCVFLHAAFDVGGTLIPQIGTGNFQDLCFWIFTAVAGVLCFVYMLLYLLSRAKREPQPPPTEQQSQ